MDSGTNQETCFRPPRGCSAEAFGLRLLQDRATFWRVWMVGIGDVSGQPPPAPSHPTLKEVSEEFAYISGVMRHGFRRKTCSVPFCCLSWSQMLGCADIQPPHLLTPSATPKGYLSLLGLFLGGKLSSMDRKLILRATHSGMAPQVRMRVTEDESSFVPGN